MIQTTTTNNGRQAWKIETPMFYATYKEYLTGMKVLTDVAYVSNAWLVNNTSENADYELKILGSTKLDIQEASKLLHPVTGTVIYPGIDIDTEPDRLLEGFIILLYVNGILLTSNNGGKKLQEDIDANNLNSMYRRIVPFDFLVRTGRLIYDSQKLLPGAPRPSALDVPHGSFDVALAVIKELGLYELANYLLVSRGINLDEYKQVLDLWKTTQQEREAYIYSYLIPFCRANYYLIISNDQIDKLIQ